MSRKNRKLNKVIRPVAAPVANRVTTPATVTPRVTVPAPVADRNISNVVNVPASAPQASIADDKPAASAPRVSKASLQAAVKAKWGYTAPKSWTIAKLEEALRGERSPRGSQQKAELRSAMMEKFNAAPKSYSCKRMLGALTGTEKAPGRSAKSGGLTADKCRELLSAARKGGMTVPAYSKLKADELRQLVGQLGL